MQQSPKCFIDRKLFRESSDRLKHLSVTGLPFFCFVDAVARRLGESERLRYTSKKPTRSAKPAYSKITALTLGLDSIQDADTCLVPVDEELTPSQVKQRRDEQVQRLLPLLKSHAAEMPSQSSLDLETYLKAFLAVWQPSAKEHDALYEYMVTPGELNDEAFEQTRAVLDQASFSEKMPTRKELTKGLAFAVTYFHKGFTATNLPLLANIFIQDLGIIATRLVNEDAPASVRRGLRVFEVLWAHGHVPAGLHLAQTCLQYLNAPEYHAYGARVVEDVWDAWQRRPHEFTERESIEMLYKLRARAMAERIMHNDDDRDVGQATWTLIKLHEQAAMLGFAEWHLDLEALLLGHCKDPSQYDPQSIHALRGRILQFPRAKAVWEAHKKRFLEQRAQEAMAIPRIQAWLDGASYDRGESHE